MLIVFGLAPPVFAESQNLISLSATYGNEVNRESVAKFFPSIYFNDYFELIKSQEAAKPYYVPAKEEAGVFLKKLMESRSMLLNNDVLAFYGHPLSEKMGILGRYTMEDLNVRLSNLAEEYRAVNGGKGVIKAFYLIYGTVWPKGEIGILKESVLQEYLDYALKNDILIFLDHQIGRYHPADALKKMLPYLKYPNVHLALDPEWRTTKPMQEFGSVTGEEINQVQQIMEDYLIEQQIPGERMLVIHQFHYSMIKNRENIVSNFEKVRLIHCADGIGHPALKRESYAFNAKAANIPIKGFKLFYNFNIPGAGFDKPLLTPKEVYELNPRPYIIMYQ
ncbi:MAG: hypothetical protein LBQ88_05495 [Treponema sp.]|nr:hypothetical protein [Treponema sp.]